MTAHPQGEKQVPDPYKELLGQIIIVDTDSHYLYLGRLEHADREYLKLAEVDVHEITQSSLSKERYAHEARDIGVRSNRKYTWVRLDRVLSISRLDDVIEF